MSPDLLHRAEMSEDICEDVATETGILNLTLISTYKFTVLQWVKSSPLITLIFLWPIGKKRHYHNAINYQLYT